MNNSPRAGFYTTARLLTLTASLAGFLLSSCSQSIVKLRERSERDAAARVEKWGRNERVRYTADSAATQDDTHQSRNAQTRVTENPGNSFNENVDSSQDLQQFVKMLRKAVKARDVVALAAMMTPDFGYNLTPVMEGAGVFEFWDNNNLWGELDKIVRSEFKSFKGYMVAPPQFADPTQPYAGYRAGLRKTPAGWRFAYFVSGI